MWRAHFVDRQVRAAIEDLFSRESNDMLLVNYVAGRTKNLTAEEIRSSIARCRVSLDFPVDIEALVGPKGMAKHGTRRASSSLATGSLADLVAAGVLRPPVVLVHRYKGSDLTATVIEGGRIRVGNSEWHSLSQAAVEAMRTKTGIERTANGWEFWQVEVEGKRVPLSKFRARVPGRPVSGAGTRRARSRA